MSGPVRGLLLACIVGAAPSTVRAQTVDEAAYRAFIDNGIREYSNGSYAEALASFSRAYQLRPGARVLRGIAKTRFELRQYSACLDSIDAALSANEDPLTPEMRAELEALRARAADYVGAVTLRVTPAEARVTLDGQPLSDALRDVPFRADIGRHTFDISAEGYTAEHRTVEVTSGRDTQLVEVALLHGRSSARLVASLVVGLVGLGGGVASALWLIDRGAESDRCQEALDRGGRCSSAESIAEERNLALGSLIGAGALFAAGAVGVAVSLRGPRLTTPTTASVSCGPTLRGLACGGIF
ncbi:MAG: PEGA domain-containing protein [Myxococcales bacterium]|nr:PEGA domain-containing protein [Myxococcales bacterium]